MAGPAVTAGSPVRMGAPGGKNWKGIATKILAWLSFVLGIAAGGLLAGTFVGGVINGVVGIGPKWVPVVALVVLVFLTGIDLFADGVPNRVALYCVMAMPSLARAVDGKLGDRVEDAANAVLKEIRGDMASWLGTSSAVALALSAAAAAWLVSRRTMSARASARR